METHDDIAELVGILEAKRRDLQDRVRRIAQHLENQGAAEGVIEDPGSLHQGDQVLEHLYGEEVHDLERIDAALARVHDGTYGICLVCDEPIARPRLKALPWALRCLSCEQSRELPKH